MISPGSVRVFLASASFRYLVTGCVSAAVDVGLTWLFLATGLNYRVAVALGFLGGLAANYLLHRIYTFAARHPPSTGELVRYLLVVAANLALALAIVEILHGVLGAPVIAARIAALPVNYAVGLMLIGSWVFGARGAVAPVGHAAGRAAPRD